ncbi:MAG: zinc metallopeptidase [Sandaracinaceae bacterium]|nr:zinc metallopeptidase [Sandaracinaceae bacterium]
MFYIDPLYLMLSIPPMLLAFYAQWKVTSTFKRYSQVRTGRGMTGADIAAEILRTRNIRDVRIEPVQGTLSDHYDPTSKTLRLSPEVYSGRSVAAAGVAAHEVGHAIQHAEGYAFLKMRSNLVPVLNITSKMALPTLMIGMVMISMQSALGQPVMLAGIVLFSVMVLFQLVTLPVEFDASSRALAAIRDGGIVNSQELGGARKVLSAAALTYVAAAVSSLMTLLYFLIRSGLLGDRRD